MPKGKASGGNLQVVWPNSIPTGFKLCPKFRMQPSATQIERQHYYSAQNLLHELFTILSTLPFRAMDSVQKFRSRDSSNKDRRSGCLGIEKSRQIKPAPFCGYKQ